MSHICEVELEIKDLDCLAVAAQSLGLELVRDKRTFKWYGQWVGNYPMPTGFQKSEMGHCKHAIRVVGNGRAYEIGVVMRRDGKRGFTLHFDPWNGGFGLMEIVGQDAQKLLQAYSRAVVQKQAARDGFRVQEATDAQGRVVMRLTR